MSEKKTISLSLSNDRNKTATKEQVRQSFSHGRSRVVSVEVKKKRVIHRPGVPSEKEAVDIVDKMASVSDLTKEEWGRRISVLKDAMQIAREEEAAAAEITEAPVEEAFPEENVEAHEDVAADVDTNSDVVVEEPVPEETVYPVHTEPAEERNSSHKNKKRAPEKEKKNASENYSVKRDIKELRGKYAKGAAKVSIYNIDSDAAERTRSIASLRRAKQKNVATKTADSSSKVVREVIIPEVITVQDLASRMSERGVDVVKHLMKMGMMVKITQVIDADTAELVATDMGHKVKRVSDSDVEIGLKTNDDGAIEHRPPVVTVMGHVDHGKTSLLDALRKTDVTLSEAGGITQHIGAYQITLANGSKITFIDTPGHAAFTDMRSRGANVTDIVVLVVAADDGVKEQTIEAINHAKAAEVPIIIAINKMDKPDANPDRVRNALLAHELVVESLGGDIIDVEISARTGQGLEKLEELILLQSEMMDIRADSDKKAEGVVLESRMDKGVGSVSTILVQRGTLRTGDIFVSGHVSGRVRLLRDDCMKKADSVLPGTPCEVIGFPSTVNPGDDFVVVESEERASEIAMMRDRRRREKLWVKNTPVSADQLFSKIADEKLKILSVIVKGDVHGSIEAIEQSLHKIRNDEVCVRVIHSAVGGVSESDVVLAKAAKAAILCFNVRPNNQAREMIARDNIVIRFYSVIYSMIDDVKKMASGLLAPTLQENVIANVQVRKVFNISKVGVIAGCFVLDGIVKRGCHVRLIRDGIVRHNTTIRSLQRGKDDAKEVKSGFECGIMLEAQQDLRENDVLECFEIEEVAREME